MDALEQLAQDSQIVAAALMTADGAIHLFDVDEVQTLSLGVLMELTKREARYIGTIGYKHDGSVVSEPANYEPDTVQAMLSALPAFVRYAAGKLVAARGDSVSWIERLHALPDTRTN
jgi:hypothetical protein